MSSPSGFIPTVLVTGAGTGIGRATSEVFLNHGWNVILVGRRIELLAELAARVPDRALPVPCDLTKPSEVQALVERVLDAKARPPFGGHLPSSLTAVINNAGIYERRGFFESDDEMWRHLFEANLLGPVRLTRLLAPTLIANGGGVIVNISSTLGLRPVAETSAYSASKAAMVNWTQSLALELASAKVRVNCVCPGIVDTPIHGFHARADAESERTRAAVGALHPLGRMGRPEEIASAVFSLCAPGSEWTTGAVLAVDGGISLT